MKADKDNQKSIREYGLLHRQIFIYRYDRALMVLLVIVFVGSMGVLVTAPKDPQTASDYEHWAIAVFGLCVAGMLLSFVVNLITARILMQELERLKDQIHLDGDCNFADGAETESQQERAIPKSHEDGLSFHSLSKSDLRKLSSRDLTAGWRSLVMIPLVVGGLLLVLAIGAWQVPRLGNLVFQHGVRLEYLCVGGLVLMMIGAYLIPLGNIVYRRACKRNRGPQ